MAEGLMSHRLWQFGDKQTGSKMMHKAKTFKTITSFWCTVHSAPSSARSSNTLKATLMQQQLNTARHLICFACSHMYYRSQIQNNKVLKTSMQVYFTMLKLIFSKSVSFVNQKGIKLNTRRPSSLSHLLFVHFSCAESI